jgi:small-conductance mechanosensitive channel
MAVNAEQTATGDVTLIVSGLERVVDQFVSGLVERVAAIGSISQEIATLHASFAAGGTSAGVLAIQIVVVSLVTATVFFLCRRQFKRPDAGVWRQILSTLAAFVIAVAAGLLAERLLFVQGLSVRTLRLWVLITAIGILALVGVRSLLRASRPMARANVGHLANLARDLSIAIGWAMVGLALMTTLRLWSAGPGLLDLVGNLVVALPTFGLFALTVWRHRRTLAATVAGSRPRSRWQGRLARIWPGVILGFLIVTLLSAEFALTLGVPLPGTTVLLTIVIVFLTPHLDAIIATSANRAMESARVSIVSVAARQTARFAVLIIMLTMLGAIWATPLATGFGINLHSIAANAVHVALIAIAAAFLWSVVGTVTGRALHEGEASTHADQAVPRSRLGTLVPLLSGISKSTILALAFLSVLVSVGVNVWPLITGLSVFGLAIGFGSQTLVKDIVSGLFFLVDDAFRMGEYIETSGAKGTVEKISVRSVTLRNARGPIATVPYGQMGKIQNFSRDYAIEKLAFRVHFDTDVELVRKLFKKIGQDVAADPELAPDLIETFKSQGIADVEDGTLVIRGKFVAKPGKQSMIRRSVLKAVHQAFRENGIHAVPKPLTGDAAQPAAS